MLIATMLAITEMPATGWGLLAAIATPLLGGVAYAGRWLLKRLDTAETSKDALYAKIISDVLPALSSSTDLSKQLLEALDKTEKLTAELLTRLDAAEVKAEELRRQELALARKRGSGA